MGGVFSVLNKRLKNYGLWAAVFALVAMACDSFGLKILPDNYEVLCKAVLGVAVLAGIINDPTTEHSGYRDDLY